MPLTCSCSDDGDWEYWIWPPDDYSVMPFKGRRIRCSCGKVLNFGDTVTKFRRTRDARSDVEIAIYGEGDPDSIELATKYLCEPCSDVYFSLHELGFECVGPDENMLHLAKEYAELQKEARGRKVPISELF